MDRPKFEGHALGPKAKTPFLDIPKTTGVSRRLLQFSVRLLISRSLGKAVRERLLDSCSHSQSTWLVHISSSPSSRSVSFNARAPERRDG